MQALEDVVLVQLVNDFKEDILVGSDDGLGDLIVAIEETPRDLNDVVDGVFVPLEECQCKGCESVIEGESVKADHNPLPAIYDSLLLDESLDDIEVAALSISLVIFGHFGQHKHEEGRILLKRHLSGILWDGIIDSVDVSAHEALLLAKPLDEQFDGLVALTESAKHVVEMSIVDIELVFEMLLKLVNHHILRSLLHLLEHLIHVVVILRLLVLMAVVVGVVEEDQFELFPSAV